MNGSKFGGGGRAGPAATAGQQWKVCSLLFFYITALL